MGESIGYLVGLMVIPLTGFLLLFLGVWRYRARQSAAVPPQAQQSGPPGWYPYPGAPLPPPPAPKRTGGAIALIVVGCVLLVLGLAGAGLAALGVADDTKSTSGRPSAADVLQVGQCITDGQYASAEMSPQPADCGERDAVYELVYQGEGPAATCPDGLREKSGYAVLFNSSNTYCFVLNVEEGQCFSANPDAQLFTPVDCADPSATSRIESIIDGVEDLSLCPAGPQGAAFPEPARTYCVVPPE